MLRYIFLLFLVLSFNVQARSIEEQLTESFNNLMNKSESSFVYHQKKLCEKKLVEHQVHIFDDHFEEYYTVPVFLPENFAELEEVCGSFGGNRKRSSQLEKVSANELRIKSLLKGCFRSPDYKLTFLSKDSGLMHQIVEDDNSIVVGSFTINPL